MIRIYNEFFLGGGNVLTPVYLDEAGSKLQMLPLQEGNDHDDTHWVRILENCH